MKHNRVDKSIPVFTTIIAANKKAERNIALLLHEFRIKINRATYM